MLTLGLLLNQLSDKVTQMIQQFQNAGLILEVNGGAQIQNLISNAQEALKDALNTAANDLTAQQQQLVSGLSGLVDDLGKKVIDNLTAKAQTIANTLPFANYVPQIASFSGNVVASNIAGDVDFQVNGNFLDIGEAHYDAQLSLGGVLVSNTTKTTQTLTFKLPKTNFNFAANTISYVPFSVTIPYRVKELGGIFHKKETTTFNFSFVVLPTSPGYFILQTSSLADVRQEAADSCNGLIWDSSQDDKDEIHGCNMSDGWQCEINSVTYSFSRQEGDKGTDWFDLGNASTTTYVGWHFKTLVKHWATSGKLTANLNYRKWKTVSQKQTTTGDNTPLQWGESKVLTVDPTATWKLTFYQFNGVSKDYATSDSSNPYLKIGTAGNQISIKIIPQ